LNKYSLIKEINKNIKIQMKFKINSKRLNFSLLKATKSLWNSTPIILATLLLVSLLKAAVPLSFYLKIFSDNAFFDSIIGTAVGSISAGNAITSYIVSGELLKQGISLFAVTAFMVAWTTVGLIQLPAESAILGKKFAIFRNTNSFILAILVSIITVLLLRI